MLDPLYMTLSVGWSVVLSFGLFGLSFGLSFGLLFGLSVGSSVYKEFEQ